MKNIIHLKNVSKKFGEQVVLKDISHSIQEGSFTALIGCNGAGKSTLLKLMAGAEFKSSGSIEVWESDPYDFDYHHRSEIFFVHEEMNLNLPFSLGEFVGHYKVVFPKWDQNVFDGLVKARKVDTKKNYQELSRGQKMQFMLIMGLSSGARLLLLDEITSILDFDAQNFLPREVEGFLSQRWNCGDLDQYFV